MKLNLPKIFIFISLFVLFGVRGFSQDMHFSQFDAAPLFYNPSQAGLLDCERRLMANFKGQWSTYNSSMISYDQPIKQLQFRNSYFGAGVLVTIDRGGEASYGNTQLRLMPAYHHNITPNLRLSLGLDVLLNITNIDEDDVIFGGSIDPETGQTTPGADLENTMKFYSDLGAGLNIQYKFSDGTPINVGFTSHRLFGSGGGGIASEETMPNYRKFSINANSEITAADWLQFLPSFVLVKQKRYQEMNFGSFAKFKFREESFVLDAVYVGAWHRYKDAVILGFAFDMPITAQWKMNFGFSYDITVSSFRKSNKWIKTNNVGKDSFEFAIKFTSCRAPIIINPEGIINDPFR